MKDTGETGKKVGGSIAAFMLYLNLFIAYFFSLVVNRKWESNLSNFIIPICESHDHSLLHNYRLISKLSTLPKLFKKLLIPKMYGIFHIVY